MEQFRGISQEYPSILRSNTAGSPEEGQVSFPILKAVELKVDVAGQINTRVESDIWSALDLRRVEIIRSNACSEGFWSGVKIDALPVIEEIDLSGARMKFLPSSIKYMTSLKHLKLDDNDLSVLPRDICSLSGLQTLSVANNSVSILPGELGTCELLEEINLQNNKLTKVLLQFRRFQKLKCLLLDGNPLETLPDLSGCNCLQRISLLGLDISSDPDYKHFQISRISSLNTGSLVVSFLGQKKECDVEIFYDSVLNKSSGHHPLLVGALSMFPAFLLFMLCAKTWLMGFVGSLMGTKRNGELITAESTRVQQLLLMLSNEDAHIFRLVNEMLGKFHLLNFS